MGFFIRNGNSEWKQTYSIDDTRQQVLTGDPSEISITQEHVGTTATLSTLRDGLWTLKAVDADGNTVLTLQFDECIYEDGDVSLICIEDLNGAYKDDDTLKDQWQWLDSLLDAVEQLIEGMEGGCRR